MITTEVLYNFELQTASLRFMDGVTEITTYYLANGQITLSARASAISLSVADLKANIDKINNFVYLIKNYLKLVPGVHSKYKISGKKFNNSFKGDLEINGIVLADIQYLTSTELVTFQPRAQQVLAFGDFLLFVDCLNLTINELTNW